MGNQFFNSRQILIKLIFSQKVLKRDKNRKLDIMLPWEYSRERKTFDRPAEI